MNRESINEIGWRGDEDDSEIKALDVRAKNRYRPLDPILGRPFVEEQAGSGRRPSGR